MIQRHSFTYCIEHKFFRDSIIVFCRGFWIAWFGLVQLSSSGVGKAHAIPQIDEALFLRLVKHYFLARSQP